jgi:hypothetical protein
MAQTSAVFSLLGGVFLCVTGAGHSTPTGAISEADPGGVVGHRVSWPRPQQYRQSRHRARSGIADKIFYQHCPAQLVVPMIVTVATEENRCIWYLI